LPFDDVPGSGLLPGCDASTWAASAVLCTLRFTHAPYGVGAPPLPQLTPAVIRWWALWFHRICSIAFYPAGWFGTTCSAVHAHAFTVACLPGCAWFLRGYATAIRIGTICAAGSTAWLLYSVDVRGRWGLFDAYGLHASTLCDDWNCVPLPACPPAAFPLLACWVLTFPSIAFVLLEDRMVFITCLLPSTVQRDVVLCPDLMLFRHSRCPSSSHVLLLPLPYNGVPQHGMPHLPAIPGCYLPTTPHHIPTPFRGLLFWVCFRTARYRTYL